MTSRMKFSILTILFTLSCCQPLLAEPYNKKLWDTCTVTQCTMLPAILNPNEQLLNQAIIFESSFYNGFFTRYEKEFSDANNGGWQHIILNEGEFADTHSIVGFGGAFTDSAAILYQHMHPELKKALIDSYFSSEGVAYSIGRVPIASCDFSCRKLMQQTDQAVPYPTLSSCENIYSLYSYADQPDDRLNNFALQPEDKDFKIPMIHAALLTAESNQNALRLFASPWSAPAWMKSNGSMIHGSLHPQFQQLWVNYIIKFLQAYLQEHIRFWAVTVQNEPVQDVLGRQAQTWQTMYFTQEQEASFVKYYLGPTLTQFAREYGSKIHIIMHDDQILTIKERVTLLNDAAIRQYVDGVGLHWYTNLDFFYPALDDAYQTINQQNRENNKFILGTEACEGFLPGERGPLLGSWSRGESYAHDIINDLNHHVSGWTDWNLILDRQGGPNWAKNYVDAPIIVDLSKQEFYRQPMFYYLGHFSRFIRPDAKLIASRSEGPFPLEEVSFYVPAHKGLPETIVIVVLNRDITSREYYIFDKSISGGQKYLNMHIPGHSIQSIIFRNHI